MSDPTGLTTGLGVESVEWFPEGREHLTVRVSGRWRRRRPTWTGSPLLVIEADGRRQPFPATPEPPSLAGAAPGTWRMSFSVPAALAPFMRGNLWLKLGVVLLPLPAAVQAQALVEAGAPAGAAEAAGKVGAAVAEEQDERPAAPAAPASQPPPPPRPHPDADTLAARRLRAAELALEASREQLARAEAFSAELQQRIEALATELDVARREPERLTQLIADRDRRRRGAEQQAYAERARREELEEQLAERERELRFTSGVQEEIAALRARVSELEDDGEDLRRRADQAQQAAAAARTARLQAERELEAIREQQRLGVRVPVGPRLRAALQAELAIAQRPSASPPEPSPAAPLSPADREMLGRERQLRAAADATHETSGARVAALEAMLEAQGARVARAYEAIADLRGVLEAVRAEREHRSSTLPSSGPVDPQRLATALTRLRSEAGDDGGEQRRAELHPTTSETESDPAAVNDWLRRAFSVLAKEQPSVAGLLALRLLPALALLHTPPTAFDLVLGEDGCVQVTVTAQGADVAYTQAPRSLAEVHFRLRGDLAGIARMLRAGRIRRRLGRRLAAVAGDRRELTVLLRLVRAQLSIGQLHAAGVRLDPSLALTVVATMVRGEWTRGERFALAHQEPGAPSAAVYLHVRDGERLSVSHQSPLGGVAATIVCPGDQLLAVLAGAPEDDLTLVGERRPLELLAGWVKRAQSG